ncbi:hypothetical protein F2P81_004621 [Scophthalmus maximus]|uniref:Uncharacterized protein n=1 Tax=Scophthalmus maximus TaxID=52904 RepID=A0A6A4TJA1_SCOMX|nr:hypothetical protein F2P81_004621 [Scophthalmus maximus]
MFYCASCSVSSGEASAYDLKTGHSKPLTFEVPTDAENGKSSPAPTAHTSYGNVPRNTAKRSVSALYDGKEESTVIRDTMFHKKAVPSEQFPSLMTTIDAFILNKDSEGYGKVSPTEISPSPVTFHAASFSRTDDVTVSSPHERSSSSWSEIIATPGTYSSSRARGAATSVSGNKSKFYSGGQTAILSTAPAAAATSSSSDGQNRIQTVGAIFSFGTKLMAPYTKWKATKPFQSGAFDSENTSSVFDWGNSNSPADGPSYEQPNLEDGQERDAHILNSTDPAAVASDLYSVYPNVGGYPSYTYVKGTSDYDEQSMNLSPANLRFVAAVGVQQPAAVNTAAPSVWRWDTSLPLSHKTTDSVASSQATLLESSSPLAHDAAVTLSNDPAHSFPDTDYVVVSIYVRRNRLDSIQRQNLRRGLSQGLRKALNDTSAQAQVETVFGSPNMTVAYHVTGGDIVYPPSVVLEGLDSYGRDKLIADLRQYLPMVTALPLPAALWRPGPAAGFQLKTVLQFVGAGDNPRSCRFSQMMEQRLGKVFSEAQAKVLSANSRLSVQMLSVTQAAGSPAVSLVYTVSNGTVFLNGTTASNLLGQLSAELVGYFLFYPPLIIAEPLEYHNLNTSIATRDFWVITVIQDVDNASLEGQYQSFASLMEQRLAELFVLAGQQGTRFRRATTVGSYTVQMVSIRRESGVKNPAEMTYYVQHAGAPLSGASAAKVLNTVDSQTMALTLGYFVQLQAEPVVKNPPNNLWIIAAVLAPIAVVTLIIIIITAVLCRKNKNDLKADAIGNLNPRAKPVQGFDYAKQHLGQQGGDEETLPVSQDTLVMSLQIRDTPLSLEKALQQDGTANKKSLSSDKHRSKLPSEDGSVISNESEKLNSSRSLTAPKVTAQQKLTKEETRKRDDPYDSSSGSLQLISIKPVVAQPSYSHPASSDRSQDSAIVNGEVNLALKQKSDIEHYRNKLRLKAKRKGYYDFPSTDGSSSSRALAQTQRHGHERAAGEHGRPLEPDDERGSTYVKSHRRST